MFARILLANIVYARKLSANMCAVSYWLIVNLGYYWLMLFMLQYYYLKLFLLGCY